MLPQRRRRRRSSSSRCSSQRLLLLQAPGESLVTTTPQAAAASAAESIPSNALPLFSNRAYRRHSLRSSRAPATESVAPRLIHHAILPATSLLPATRSTATTLLPRPFTSHGSSTVTKPEAGAVTVPEGAGVRTGTAPALETGGATTAAARSDRAAASSRRAEAAVVAPRTNAIDAASLSPVSPSRAAREGVKLRGFAKSNLRRRNLQTICKRTAFIPSWSTSVAERGALVLTKNSLPSVNPTIDAAAAAAPPTSSAVAAFSPPVAGVGAGTALPPSVATTVAAVGGTLPLIRAATTAAAAGAASPPSNAVIAAAASSPSLPGAAAAVPVHSVVTAPAAASPPSLAAAGGVAYVRVEDELSVLHSDIGEEGSRTPSTTCSEYGKEIPAHLAAVGGLSHLINTCSSIVTRGNTGVHGYCCCSRDKNNHHCCREKITAVAAARQSQLILRAQQHHQPSRRGIAGRGARLSVTEESRVNGGAGDIAAAVKKKRRKDVRSCVVLELQNEQQCLQQSQEKSLAVHICKNSIQKKAELCRCTTGTSCPFMGGHKLSMSTRRKRISGFLSQGLYDPEQQQQDGSITVYKMGLSVTDIHKGNRRNSSKKTNCRSGYSGHSKGTSFLRRMRSSSSNVPEKKKSSVKDSVRDEKREMCTKRINIGKVKKQSSSNFCTGLSHMKTNGAHCVLSRDLVVKQDRERVAAAGACGTIAKRGKDKAREIEGRSVLSVNTNNDRSRSASSRSDYTRNRDSHSCSSMKKEEMKTHCIEKRSNSCSRKQTNNCIMDKNTLREKMLAGLQEKSQREKKKQQHQKVHIQSKQGQVNITMKSDNLKDRVSFETLEKQGRQGVDSAAGHNVANLSPAALRRQKAGGDYSAVRVGVNTNAVASRRRKCCGSSASRVGEAVSNTGAGDFALEVSDCPSVQRAQHRGSERKTLFSFPAASEKPCITTLSASRGNRRNSATGFLLSGSATGIISGAAAAATDEGVLTRVAGGGHLSAPDDMVVVQQLHRQNKHMQSEKGNTGLLLQQRQKQLFLKNQLPVKLTAFASTDTRQSSTAGTPLLLLPATAARLGSVAPTGRCAEVAEGKSAAKGAAPGKETSTGVTASREVATEETAYEGAATARRAVPYKDGSRTTSTTGIRFDTGGSEEEKDWESDAENKQHVVKKRQQQQHKEEHEAQRQQAQRYIIHSNSATDVPRSFLTLLKQLRQRPQQRAVRGSGAVAAAIKRRQLAAQRRLLWKEGSVANKRVAQQHEEPQLQNHKHPQQQIEKKVSEALMSSAIHSANAAALAHRSLPSSSMTLSSEGLSLGSTAQVESRDSRQLAPARFNGSLDTGALCKNFGVAAGSAVGEVGVASAVSLPVVHEVAEAAAEPQRRSCLCKSSERVKLPQCVRLQPRGRLLPSLCSFCSRRVSLTLEQPHQCTCNVATSQQGHMQQQQRRDVNLQQRLLLRQQQNPRVHDSQQVPPHSDVLLQQQVSLNTAEEERRGRKRGRCDDEKRIEEAQQKQQHQQPKVFQEQLQIAKYMTQAVNEKEWEENSRSFCCCIALQKGSKVSANILDRERTNSRREIMSTVEHPCTINGKKEVQETAPNALAAMPLAAAIVGTPSPYVFASCGRRVRTTDDVHTPEHKMKKETSRLDGIYWTSAVSRPSRRGRENSAIEKCNVVGRGGDNKCYNSIVHASRGTSVTEDTCNTSFSGIGNSSEFSENTNNIDSGRNSLPVVVGTIEDKKGKYVSAVCAGTRCLGDVFQQNTLFDKDSGKGDKDLIETQREYKEGPGIDASYPSAVLESPVNGEEGRCTTDVVAEDCSTLIRSVVAARQPTAHNSDNGRVEAAMCGIDAVPNGEEYSSSVCDVGATCAAEFVAPGAPSPLQAVSSTRAGMNPLCTCCNTSNKASGEENKKYRTKLKVRSRSAAARKARGRRVRACKLKTVSSTGVGASAVTCIRHHVGGNLIPEAVPRQSSGDHIRVEVTEDQQQSQRLPQQQQSEQPPQQHVQQQSQQESQQQQLEIKHPALLQEQQKVDVHLEEQSKERGEGFCVAYIRSLARRGGWERVPPSLLLLLLPSELIVKRNSSKKYSMKSGSQEKAGDAATGRSGPGMPTKKHKGLLGRRGEIARLLLVQNEWEKASAVSRWKKAREAGRIETLESFRSRVRGEISPAAAALRWAGIGEHPNAF